MYIYIYTYIYIYRVIYTFHWPWKVNDPYTFALQIDLHFATVAIEINIREAAESHGWCQSLNRTTRCICALELKYMTGQ